MRAVVSPQVGSGIGAQRSGMAFAGRERVVRDVAGRRVVGMCVRGVHIYTLQSRTHAQHYHYTLHLHHYFYYLLSRIDCYVTANY